MATIVFLHGGPAMVDYLQRFFADQFEGHQIVFYTQSKSANSIDDYLFELDEKIQDSQTPVVLVGHSWGGTLALERLRRGPIHLALLVLISAPYSSDFELDHQNEKRLRKIEDASPHANFLSNEERPEWEDFLNKAMASVDIEAFGKMNASYLKSYDHRETLKKTETAILNIFGSEDIRVPASYSKKAAQLNSKISNIEIKGAGHFPFLRAAHRNKVVKSIKTALSDLTTISKS